MSHRKVGKGKGRKVKAKGAMHSAHTGRKSGLPGHGLKKVHGKQRLDNKKMISSMRK